MRQLLEFCLCRLLESLDKEEDAELLMTAAQACKRCVFYACVRWETHAEGVLLLYTVIDDDGDDVDDDDDDVDDDVDNNDDVDDDGGDDDDVDDDDDDDVLTLTMMSSH